MVKLTQPHMIGIVLTLLLIIAIGIHSGKKVKNASDFSTGGRSASSTIVLLDLNFDSLFLALLTSVLIVILGDFFNFK